MKLRAVMVIITALCLAGPLFGEDRAPLKEKDKISYVIGADVGKLLKEQGVEVNLNVVKGAIQDVLSGKKLLLSEDEMAQVKAGAEKAAAEGKQKRLASLAERNKREEEQFLEANKKKEGVVVLPSGLQYKVIKAGSGKRPMEDNLVEVHYRVGLIDGTEIESSKKKGGPQTFDLDNVVPGWREGAMLMQTGSVWQLYVPSKLAYGEDGVGELVGPNTMLIFDLELLKILDKPVKDAGDKPEDKT